MRNIKASKKRRLRQFYSYFLTQKNHYDFGSIINCLIGMMVEFAELPINVRDLWWNDYSKTQTDKERRTAQYQPIANYYGLPSAKFVQDLAWENALWQKLLNTDIPKKEFKYSFEQAKNVLEAIMAE